MFDYIPNQLFIQKIRRPRKKKIVVEKMKRLKQATEANIPYIIVYKNDGSNMFQIYCDMNDETNLIYFIYESNTKYTSI
jgi:hypothetical protein